MVENKAGVTVDLAKTTVQNIGVFGNDTFSGFDYAMGGGGADTFYGSAKSNYLDGNGGNDTLVGRAGVDTLYGSAGADIMIGGADKDFIGCFDGNGTPAARDIIRYTALTDSGLTSATMDSIGNFDKGGLATDDKIDLSFLDANAALAGNQAFTFRGAAAAFNQAGGEVRLVTTGGHTYVHIDTDADAASEMIIEVSGVTGLTAADFIL